MKMRRKREVQSLKTVSKFQTVVVTMQDELSPIAEIIEHC